MLLIQKIELYWDKKERNAKSAKIRSQFPMAYLFPQTDVYDNVMVDYQHFDQYNTEIFSGLQQKLKRLLQYLKSKGLSNKKIQYEIAKEISSHKKHQFRCYSSVENIHQKLHLHNVSICQNENEYEISFFYNGYGIPTIRGHNKDYNNPNSLLYRKDYLNEVAFTLKQNQYGRIIWNNRNIYFDTGEWYYTLHIYNLYVTDKIPKNDIFVSNTPDFIYKQMAALY